MFEIGVSSYRQFTVLQKNVVINGLMFAYFSNASGIRPLGGGG